METKEPLKTISMVWFDNGRIYIRTDDGMELSQPLEVFPVLMEASALQREKYALNKWRDVIRWEDLDEDIHISSFFTIETVNYDNEVNRLLSRFTWLDMKEFARIVGMHWTKLSRFRSGVWTPTPETFMKIKNGVRAIAEEMSAAAV